MLRLFNFYYADIILVSRRITYANEVVNQKILVAGDVPPQSRSVHPDRPLLTACTCAMPLYLSYCTQHILPERREGTCISPERISFPPLLVFRMDSKSLLMPQRTLMCKGGTQRYLYRISKPSLRAGYAKS